MFKQWRIYIPLVINLCIIGFYTKQRQFLEDKWSTFNWGDLVVVATLGVMTIIAMYSIYVNTKLYTTIKEEIRPLDGREKTSPLFREISAKFKTMRKEDGINDVNIPSHLEEHMSEYTIKLKIVKPFDMPATKIIKITQMFISMTILIGVLGTFIGLIISLASVSDSGESGNVLNGINTAFYTSIAGILNSIAINLITRFQNSDQLFVQLLLKLENLMYAENKDTSDREIVNALEKVVASVKDMQQSFIDLSTFSKHFQSSAVKLEKFNASFSTSTDKLANVFTKMDNTVSLFENRTRVFHEDFGELFTYLNTVTQKQTESNDFVMHMTGTMKQFVDMSIQHREQQNEFLQSIVTDVRQSNEQQTLVLTDAHTNLEKQYMTTRKVFKKFNDYYVSLADQHQLALEQQTQLAEKNGEQLEVVQTVTEQMQAILQNSHFKDLEQITTAFNESFVGTVGMIEQIAKSIQQMEQRSDTQTEHFTQVAQLMMDGAKKSERQTQLITAGISEMQTDAQQLRTQLVEVVQTFNQYGKNEELLTALSDKMSTAFTNNYQVLEKQNIELKEALQKYLDESSAILNGQLTSMIKQFNEFLNTTNQQMDHNLKTSIDQFKNYIERTNIIISQKLTELVDNKFIFDQFNAIMLNELQQRPQESQLQGGMRNE